MDKRTTKQKGNWRNKERGNSREVDISTLVYGKVPPQSVDLEKAILGAIMLEKGAFEHAAELLKPESFYVDAHQRIFQAFMKLSDQSTNIDLLTVTAELRKAGDLDMIGGPYALTLLTQGVTGSAHIDDHCQYVHEMFLKREMIRAGHDILYKAYEDETDAFELLDHAEKMLFDLTSGNVKTSFQSTADLAVPTIEKVEHQMNNQQDLTGVPTGFRPLDAVTGGWQATDLIILAARPSVGKTALALNLARNAATHPIKPTGVGIFSLEMSKDQLMLRLASSESRVNLEYIMRGRLDQSLFGKVREGLTRLSQAPIFIDDSASLTIFELRAKARMLVSKHKVGLIIIDYLQLMNGDEGRGNREQEISKISRKLKGLAKEMGIPVIALSQMSRDIEKRSGGIPQLSDLRESGAIEQDADVVGFVYRPDYQKEDSKVDPAVKNEAFVKIAKHRNGKLETLAFHTDLSIQTWFDPSQWAGYKQGTSLFGDGNWRKIEPEPVQQQSAGFPEDDLPF